MTTRKRAGSSKKRPTRPKKSVRRQVAGRKGTGPKKSVSRQVASKKGHRRTSTDVRRKVVGKGKAKARKTSPKRGTEPKFWFVRANARAEHVSTLSDQLFALGAQGLEERDDTTLEKGVSGKVTVVASFPGEAEARA